MENTHDTEIKEQGLQLVNTLLNKPSKETVALIKNAILTGDSDAAYTGIVLKKFAKIAEEVKKDKTVQDIIVKETKKYQEGTVKTFTLHGAKITLANRGVWDYSQTEDLYLQRLKEIEKEVKELIKLRESHLQSLVAEYEIKNKPKPISAKEAFEETESPIKFGALPFNVSWDNLPKLIFEDAYAEVSTTAPVKRGIEQLRYSL